MSFTAEARKEATRDGAPAIDLIDGEALCALLRERELGVRVRQVVRWQVARWEVAVLPAFFAESERGARRAVCFRLDPS